MLNPSKCWLALFLCASVLAAAPPKSAKSVPLDVSGDTVRVVRSFPITITAPAGGKDYTWIYPSSLDADESENRLTIKSAPKGTHKIRVKVVYQDDKLAVTFDKGEILITVGDVAPPPGPGPTPKPPDPVPAGAMRVLIVYESADLVNLPKEQRLLINDLPFQGTLTDRCDKKGPGGMGWAIWDKDQDTSKTDKFWQDALKKERPSVPYIQIYKADKLVKEQALPATKKEVLDLINQFAE